jgi:hypothetical protein
MKFIGFLLEPFIVSLSVKTVGLSNFKCIIPVNEVILTTVTL